MTIVYNWLSIIARQLLLSTNYPCTYVNYINYVNYVNFDIVDLIIDYKIDNSLQLTVNYSSSTIAKYKLSLYLCQLYQLYVNFDIIDLIID